MNNENQITGDESTDVIEYLVPFIAACRRQCDNNTLAEIQVARQLVEVVYAITSELDCDTQDEGVDAKLLIESALQQIFRTLNTVERDVSRPAEERRAELVAKLSRYQRELLGIVEEDSDE